MVNYVRPVLRSPLKWCGMTGQAVLFCIWGWSQGKGIRRQEVGFTNFFLPLFYLVRMDVLMSRYSHVSWLHCLWCQKTKATEPVCWELYISLVKRQWWSWVVTLQHAALCVMILDSPIYIRSIMQLKTYLRLLKSSCIDFRFSFGVVIDLHLYTSFCCSHTASCSFLKESQPAIRLSSGDQKYCDWRLI